MGLVIGASLSISLKKNSLGLLQVCVEEPHKKKTCLQNKLLPGHASPPLRARHLPRLKTRQGALYRGALYPPHRVPSTCRARRLELLPPGVIYLHASYI